MPSWPVVLCMQHAYLAWNSSPAGDLLAAADDAWSMDVAVVQALQKAVQQMQSRRLLPASVAQAMRQLLQQQHGKVQVSRSGFRHWDLDLGAWI